MVELAQDQGVPFAAAGTGRIAQLFYDRILVDIQTSAVVAPGPSIISRPISAKKASTLVAWFRASCVNDTAARGVAFLLYLNGAKVSGCGCFMPTAASVGSCSLLYVSPPIAVAAINTFEIYFYAIGGGNAKVQPVSSLYQGAELLTQEIG